jgi:ribosomal protein S18 acetylase RimI-like enzyme
MPILIAKQEDIPALNKLVNSAYRGDSSKLGWTSEADLLGGIRTNEKLLEEEMKKIGNTILKYVNEELEICGSVLLQIKDKKIYLGMLTVSPILQNKGIGKLLLEAAENYALDNQCNAIYMTVISLRTELIAWYERHGYQKTGEIVPFPMNNSNFGLPKTFLEMIVLEKAIRKAY